MHFTAAGAERSVRSPGPNAAGHFSAECYGSFQYHSGAVSDRRCFFASGGGADCGGAQGRARSGRPPATLPNGVTVKLVGLSLYPTKGNRWWLPDGQECLAPLLDGSDLDIRSVHPSLHGDHTVVFAFAITGLKSGTGSEVQIASPESGLWAGRQFKSGVVQPEIKALALNVPTNATVAHLRLTFDSEERLRLEYETATNISPHFDPIRLPAGEAGVAFRNVSLRSGFRTQPTAVVLGAQWPPKRAESVAPGSTNATSLPASGSGPALEKSAVGGGASNPHRADPVRSGVSHGG